MGVELELSGITPDQMAKAVMATAGGEMKRSSPFESTVRDTTLGDFRIELDADILKSRGYQKHLQDLGIDIGEGETRENLEQVMSKVAGLVVPLELVGPPIPWTRLPELDAIRKELHEAGARGTHSSPFYAFGLHLNIEVASVEANDILSLLRAFLLRYEWLLEAEDVDFSRRITPYVQPYPEDYVRHVLDPDYQPDQRRLIDDFLAMTPTRNRPLDLLPLLAHLDEDRVMDAPVERDLIKPRPAWHYRLPNCLIDEADWSLAVPWNHWMAVEQLANQPDELETECKHYLETPGGLKRWLGERLQRFWS
ncbi:amidoligase family protein [Wenzhouxiangella sp. AB-CW3]|uniref:amidoligase family protein n=1 Tax=Wenzhouxiangella sp. AB-CW3 TaxID=2771012 RepID=UPI001CC322C5|nr:amidoligase family protein [Wenzhouxiangella sp. AB-CW3]